MKQKIAAALSGVLLFPLLLSAGGKTKKNIMPDISRDFSYMVKLWTRDVRAVISRGMADSQPVADKIISRHADKLESHKKAIIEEAQYICGVIRRGKSCVFADSSNSAMKCGGYRDASGVAVYSFVDPVVVRAAYTYLSDFEKEIKTFIREKNPGTPNPYEVGSAYPSVTLSAKPGPAQKLQTIVSDLAAAAAEADKCADEAFKRLDNDFLHPPDVPLGM